MGFIVETQADQAPSAPNTHNPMETVLPPSPPPQEGPPSHLLSVEGWLLRVELRREVELIDNSCIFPAHKSMNTHAVMRSIRDREIFKKCPAIFERTLSLKVEGEGFSATYMSSSQCTKFTIHCIQHNSPTGTPTISP